MGNLNIFELNNKNTIVNYEIEAIEVGKLLAFDVCKKA